MTSRAKLRRSKARSRNPGAKQRTPPGSRNRMAGLAAGRPLYHFEVESAKQREGLDERIGIYCNRASRRVHRKMVPTRHPEQTGRLRIHARRSGWIRLLRLDMEY